MLLDFRKPSVVIQDKCVSWTGKYFAFLGTHFHAGKPCWVVGASNKSNGTITMRHYNEENNVNAEAAQFGAKEYWNKFSEGLKRAPTASEDEEFTDELIRWFDEFDRQLPKPRIQ